MRAVPVRWRVWGLYVLLLGGVLTALGAVVAAQSDAALTGAAIATARQQAVRVAEGELGRPPPPRTPLPAPPKLEPPPPIGGPGQGPPPVRVGPPGLKPGAPLDPAGKPGPPVGLGGAPSPLPSPRGRGDEPGKLGAPPGGVSSPAREPSPGGRGGQAPPPPPPKPGDPNGTPLERVAQALIGGLNGRQLHVRVYGPDGALVAQGEKAEDLPPWPTATDDEIRRALAGTGGSRIDDGRGPRAALVMVPLVAPGGTVIGAAALAQSLEVGDDAVATLRNALVGGALLAAALGALVGVPLTGMLLAPLDRVVAAAERVSGGDLSARTGMKGRDELGRLGAAFDRMLDRLDAALDAQRRFVADASHELKSPLTGIAGTVEVLAEMEAAEPDSPRRRALRAIEREADRMGRLVTDLLTLSRLDAGQRSRRERVDLADLADDLVEALRARGVAVELEAAVRPVVLGDPDELERLLRNLLDNGTKAIADAGELRVRIDARDGLAEVVVADTGVGIPAAAVPHLFDRFYRADAARARATGGTGLGLAIARTIVEAHGGALTAESEGPGRGATFTVRLPAAGA